MTPEGFAKLFARAFGRQDAAGIAALLADDCDVLTLTGAILAGAKDAEAAFAGEFAGIFAASRLVTGKVKLRNLGPEVVIFTQRFVVSGTRDEAGQDLPRFGALLTAVVTAETGWRAVNLTFSATGQ